MRGSAPTAECFAQWAPTTTLPPTTKAPASKAPAKQAPEETPEPVALIQESFATTFALAALALYA
jgi:hypothetical protein